METQSDQPPQLESNPTGSDPDTSAGSGRVLFALALALLAVVAGATFFWFRRAKTPPASEAIQTEP